MEERKQKGITLIALVITIIVLLILVGITISLAFNNNGILKRAENAKEQNDAATKKEQQILQDIDNAIEFGVNPLIKVKEGEKATENGTIDGKASNAYNPIIPKGYYPIDQRDAVWGNGSSSPEQIAVDNGLVITDSADSLGNSNGNEWVWVPVENPKDYYIKEDIEIRNGLKKPVMTNFHTNSITLYQGEEDIGINTRVKPSDESGYREPGIIISYDNIANIESAGFAKGTTPEEFATALVKDYNDMIVSLEKYHGFYIGRYELSDDGEKRDKQVGRQNWYAAYKRAKNIIPKEAEGIVSTRMIWGLQWDATCKWISIKGERKDIQDSSDWGNYCEGSEPRATGTSERWKANNIYDLAGNSREWTQEAYNTSSRASRGGACSNSGSTNPASVRHDNSPNPYGYPINSSRSVLYVK